CIGSELAETAAEGIDEQNHQRTPQAIVERPRYPIGVTRRCGRIEGRRPDPGRRHTGGTHAEADGSVGYHELISIFLLFLDAQGKKISAAVEGEHEEYN